ncbi:MAG: acyl carrier protein [bacterium]
MDTRAAVRDFIETELDRKKKFGHLRDTDPLIEMGLIDSMGIQRLLAYLEATFSIRIEEEEILPENFETLEAIVKLLGQKMR